MTTLSLVAPVQTDSSAATRVRGLVLSLADSVDGDVTPYNLAEQLLSEIDGDHDLLVTALVDCVRHTIGHQRTGKGRPVKGTSRWERAADDLRVYRERISLGAGSYRELGDCSAEDLHQAAEMRFRHARSVEQHGERLGRLAHLLEKRGAEVVREVPVALVMEIVYA